MDLKGSIPSTQEKKKYIKQFAHLLSPPVTDPSGQQKELSKVYRENLSGENDMTASPLTSVSAVMAICKSDCDCRGSQAKGLQEITRPSNQN